MSTAEHVEACVQFTDALLRTHHAAPVAVDDPVRRCECGRAVVMCEIASAARDAGLFAALAPTAGGQRAGVGAGQGGRVSQ